MAGNAKKLFTFRSDALAEDVFTVLSFEGTEALSTLFSFDISLLAESPNLDMAALLRHPACLSISGKEIGQLFYHGIPARCILDRPVDDRFLYQVRLVPLVWRLSMIEHNQVFLNRSVVQIIDTLLRDGNLIPADFDFRLKGEYQPREYVCQYEESHYNFLARLLEHNGIYTFFDHLGGRDQLIITDTQISHELPESGGQLVFSPDSGLDGISKTKAVQRFTSTHVLAPETVRIRDYNYRTPGLEMQGEAQVSEDGFGEVYHYGDHFFSNEEGQLLAQIRAEELKCREQIFQGEATAVGMKPGYLFTLSNHFREDYNRHYLCTGMKHQGRQDNTLTGGAKEVENNWYRNSFTAINSDVQFRPERTTRNPRFSGTLNARIDGQGSGEHAELDEQGRYKVILPFDLSGRSQGKASAWLRMMQPYTGAGYGMHFPLRKGTEVLLTFVDGNPDRPVIAGAVPNPETRSVVDAENQSRSGFKTAGGSSFYSDDSPGHEHIMMKAGDNTSGFRVGAGSDSSVAAWSTNLFMGGTAMSVIGSLLANYTFAAIQDTSITGWKFGLIMKVLEKFMLRVPELTDKYDRAYTEATPNVIQHEVDLVSAVSSIVEILVELYFIALTIKEMGAEGRSAESAFMVFSKEAETLVRNKAAGKHIYLYTETGDVYQAGINIELLSGPEEENNIRLISGPSNEEMDIKAEVELMQGNITVTSGNLGNIGAAKEETDEEVPAADEVKEEAPKEEAGAVEPSGNEPPVADGLNFIKLVSGIKDDNTDAQSMLELMQGNIVLSSGGTAGDAPNSLWLISGVKGDEGNAMATAELSQGSIEMVSGEQEENYIRLVSGGPGGGGEEEASEDGEEESSEKDVAAAADDESQDSTDTEGDDTESEDESSEESEGGLAIIELKQGTVTIQSGEAQIIVSNGEITLSGLTTIEGAAEGNLMVDSDAKIILG